MAIPQNSAVLAASLAAVLYGTSQVSKSLQLSALTAAPVFAGIWGISTWIIFLLVKTNLLTPTFLLPAIIVARMTDTTKLRADFLRKTHNAQRVSFTTDDNVKLDGVVIEGPPADEKWIVWNNANGVVYEQILPELSLLSTELGVSVLCYNFRGVGASSGWPYGAQDLVSDGAAAVRYLTKQGVPEGRIMLYGHSLGGGVVGELAAKHFPKAVRVHDRSFVSLTAVAKMFMRQLGPLMSIALSIVTGGSFYLTSLALPQLEMTNFAATMIASITAGRTDVMSSLAPAMLEYAGWEMRAMDKWNAEKSLCIYHKRDEVIAYNGSSIFLPLQTAHGQGLKSVELFGSSMTLPCHMYQIHSVPADWSKTKTALLSLLDAMDA